VEPVTTLLLQALPALGGAAAGEMAKKAAADLWEGVKGVLKRRFGADATAVQLVDELRTSPANSSARLDAAERLSALNLGRDPEILGVVQSLVQALADAKAGDRTQFNATTMYGVVGTNTGTLNQTFGKD
jgi:hypothetical protein